MFFFSIMYFTYNSYVATLRSIAGVGGRSGGVEVSLRNNLHRRVYIDPKCMHVLTLYINAKEHFGKCDFFLEKNNKWLRFSTIYREIFPKNNKWGRLLETPE